MTTLPVWTRTTRAMHWVLALCIVTNLINDGDENKWLHRYAGYLAVLILGLRLIYGFVALDRDSYHSQFRNWPLSPRQVMAFIRGEVDRRAAVDYQGHNPLASYVYLFIWASILGMGITGYMMEMDAFWGEEWLEDLHAGISWALRAGIILHFVGIAKDSFSKRRRTYLAMITGKR